MLLPVTPSLERCLAWFVLASVLVMSLVPSGGAVVCVGRAGHVAIGLLAEAGCPCAHEESEHHEHDEPGQHDEHDEHGPCTDLEFDVPAFVRDGGSGEVDGRTADAKSFEPSEHALFVLNLFASASGPAESPPALPPWQATLAVPHLEQQLARQRATVLRI